MNKVSVIITSYNRFDFACEAVESIKKQTYENIEIILIDDGSTDERYNNFLDDKSVTYIKRKNNTRIELGFPCPGRVRNDAISVCSGEYICFLDDDDYFYPTKVEEQLKLMIKNQAMISCTEAHIGNSNYSAEDKQSLAKYQTEFYLNFNEKILSSVYKGSVSVFPRKITNSLIKKHNVIITSSVMVNRVAIHNMKFPEVSVFGNGKYNGKRDFEDWMMWRDISFKYDFLWIEEPLLYYNSRGKLKQKNTLIRKIRNKLRFLI